MYILRIFVRKLKTTPKSRSGFGPFGVLVINLFACNGIAALAVFGKVFDRLGDELHGFHIISRMIGVNE